MSNGQVPRLVYMQQETVQCTPAFGRYNVTLTSQPVPVTHRSGRSFHGYTGRRKHPSHHLRRSTEVGLTNGHTALNPRK
jgi:hypothetical protein